MIGENFYFFSKKTSFFFSFFFVVDTCKNEQQHEKSKHKTETLQQQLEEAQNVVSTLRMEHAALTSQHTSVLQRATKSEDLYNMEERKRMELSNEMERSKKFYSLLWTILFLLLNDL